MEVHPYHKPNGHSEEENWYLIDKTEQLDTPCLVFYYERIVDNIQRLKQMVGDDQRIRPHVKTNKSAEVCKLLQKHYINRFKCATIAEAEMLATIHAEDVLLAYQPVGPKLKRWLSLLKKYPDTAFSCLVDNKATAEAFQLAATQEGLVLKLFLDIDTGMNRTGIFPAEAEALFRHIRQLPAVTVIGLHVYDGHLKIRDREERQKQSDEQFVEIEALLKRLDAETAIPLQLVMGGSPSFSTHIHRKRAQLSPGTFVFWDAGYSEAYPDLPFKPAALVLTRVISALGNNTYTLDLGTKAVASEMPFPRVRFLNAPLLKEVFHSEEHLNVRFAAASEGEAPPAETAAQLAVGDLLFCVPFHICPTVALYDEAVVIKDRKVYGRWEIIARRRKINC